MHKLLTLAWRNVGRNRRRSLITIAAITFAFVIITFTRSMQYGTYEAIESQAIGLFTGELQVHREGYQDNETLAYTLGEDEQDWDALFSGYPWVAAYARRLTGFGLVSSDSASTGAMILGIEPRAENRVSTFARRPSGGEALRPGDRRHVLLGTTLAGNLGVAPGDTVVVLTQGLHNEMGAELYAVQGLLQTGQAEVDRALMVMPLPDAQALFSMPGRFTQFVLHTRDYRTADHDAAALRDALAPDPEAGAYEVMTWGQLMPELLQGVLLDNVSGAVFLLCLLILVGFEIFNTTTMSILERVKEFGILQAIGMRPHQISLLVLLESAIKVVLASAIGFLIAWLLVVHFEAHPIPLGSDAQALAETYGFAMNTLVFTSRPLVFLQALLSVAAISALAAVYPVVKVRQLSPVDAFRRV